MGQINHTLKIAYFSLRNINRAQGSLLSWTHLPMGTYTVVMRVARRLSHKIYTKPFPSEEPYFIFFSPARLRGTPINDEHVGRDIILCASELASVFDFWKPGWDLIQDANYFAVFNSSASHPVRSLKTWVRSTHFVPLIPGKSKSFMLKALEDGKIPTMPSAVAGLHMRWVWFLLVFHLCRTTHHGWQYPKLHRSPNTRPHTSVAAPGLASAWTVLRFPFNQPFLHSWKKIYFCSKRNTAFICQMPRGTAQCWTIAHNISV